MRLFLLLLLLGASAATAQPRFTITPDTLYWEQSTSFETPFVIRNVSPGELQLDSLTIGQCSGPQCLGDFNPAYLVTLEHGDVLIKGFIWPGNEDFLYWSEPPSVSLVPGDSALFYIRYIDNCPLCGGGGPDFDTTAPVLFWGEGQPEPEARTLAYVFPVANEPEATRPAFDLSVAGPNPFRGETAVLLRVPAPAEVAVVLFDGLGRRLGVLAEGAFGAGEHRLVVRADGLAPGLYFVRAAMRSGREGSVVTQRLVLLR